MSTMAVIVHGKAAHMPQTYMFKHVYINLYIKMSMSKRLCRQEMARHCALCKSYNL